MDRKRSKYLSQEEVKTFNKGATGIFSITVNEGKQGAKQAKPNVNISETTTANTCTPTYGCS